MNTYPLCSGHLIPVIGLGTFTMTPDEAEAAVTNALEVGYRLIDTANAYVNEKAVGRGLRLSGVNRADIFLETKLWPTLYQDETAVDKTLERLGMDYVDLMLLHQPAGDYLSGWRLLEQGVRAGKLRSIGLSNFSQGQIQKILGVCQIRPSVVQVECHPYYPQDEMRDFLRRQGIVLQAWFPLSHGDKSMLEQPVFQNLAQKYGKSTAQVILRWHIQKGNVVIPGARSQPHILDNLNIFNFALTGEEMAQIAGLDRHVPFVTHNEDEMDRYLHWELDIDGQK